MKNILLYIILHSFILLSCSGGRTSSASEVDNICSCIKKTEYFEIIKDIDFEKMNDEDYSEKITRKLNKVDNDSKESLEAFKCIAKNVKSVLTKYKDLNDDKQKSLFVRNTMTALINNECVATITDKLPFENIKEEIEKNEFGLSVKDLIKIIDKVETANDFEEIQKVVSRFTTDRLNNKICECADILLIMMKEVKALEGDFDKMKTIQEKYKYEIEKCDRLSDGKTDDEQKKMRENMEKCASYKELEKIQKEMMGGY